MTTETPQWLPAGPFRSHVRTLMDRSGLPWRAIALEARVPPAMVRTLLNGRDGQLRPKIHRIAADNLLRLTDADLHLLRRQVVSAAMLRGLVARLRRHGYTVDDIAGLLRVEPGRIRAVEAGAARASDAYTTLLARAACDALCPDDREAAYEDGLAA